MSLNDIDWDRWHELLTIRNSPHMAWAPGEADEYEAIRKVAVKLDEQERRASERHRYKLGNGISLKMRRNAGVCKWGHPNYVTGGFGINGNQNWSGDNVGIRTGRYGPHAYCLACHRAQMAKRP